MSDQTMILPRGTAQALVDLTGEVRLDTALLVLMREYAWHKMAELEAGMRDFEDKYGMPFEAYRHLWETEDRPEHYAYAAEEDFLMWEGLVTRQDRLANSFARHPHILRIPFPAADERYRTSAG